ncbi:MULTISPECIES: hypothetical protein [unclassified Saccharothrix]
MAWRRLVTCHSGRTTHLVRVAGLFRPDLLIEVDAVAAVAAR